MTASDGRFTLTSADGAGVAGRIDALAQALEGIEASMLDAAGQACLAEARASAAWLALNLGAMSGGPGGAPAEARKEPGPAGEAPDGTAPIMPPPPVDELRFRRLLEVAGTEGSAELLARLLEDLRKVEIGLGRAMASADPAEARAQSHVLIALAGAAGARTLQRLAEGLNAAARRGATVEWQRIGETTLEQLARLIAFVAAREGRVGAGQEAQGSQP
jgi:HPt (histidine-containing phosphotransfer) domain-containing protein